MIKLKILGLLSIVILVASCEGGTTYTKTIRNNSTETLSINVYSLYTGTGPIQINPGESKEIFWHDNTGQFVGNEYRCTSELDSITVSVSNGKTLQKDLMNEDNWTRASKDGKNSREDCTLTVSEEDLQ